MRFDTALLHWLWRSVAPVQWIAIPAAIVYALFAEGPLSTRDPWALLFIGVHAIAIVVRLGRPRRPDFAFLYDRGFARDTLWNHLLIVTTLSVIAVWLPAALVIWTPLRSLVQDHLVQSPFYPLMASRDAMATGGWIVAYATFIPLLHYAWIRAGQPTRGRGTGLLLAACFVFVAATLLNLPHRELWFQWLVRVAGCVLAATALVAGRRLHRHLEILP